MKNLEDYIKLVFPIIEYCAKNSQKESPGHIWYLRGQIFYGFFIVQKKNLYSKEAELEFKKLYGDYAENLSKDNKKHKVFKIEEFKWHEQPVIDPGRSQLHFEHMYTGSMFKEDCQELFDNGNLTQDAVLDLVKSNYYVCLVTKKENEMLNRKGYKSNRGKGIAGALKAYEDAEVSEVKFPDTRHEV
jgi:hypothetical protein